MAQQLDKQIELRNMKRLATSLLIIAAVIFLVASFYAEDYVWVGFVQATAEAAMVGALADWFAVTALFRHPLGIKIPHTAIVPNRKDAIGRVLGRFVRNNFLIVDVIAVKLESMDITRRLARWLSRPDNSSLLANYIAVGITAVLESVRDEDVQSLIEQTLAQRIRATKIAPILGNILELVFSGSRQQELLTGIIGLGATFLSDNPDVIKAKIDEELPWWLPKNIDNLIYQKIVDVIDRTRHQVGSDPNHPLHEQFGELVTRFADDLKHSPDILAKEEAFKEEMLKEPAVHEFSVSLWSDLKSTLISDDPDTETDIRQPIQQAIARFGIAILENDELLVKIDYWVQQAVFFLVREHGHEVERLIEETIYNWDPKETADKIELQVGKDLQFIRINGTIVGGLAGLIIHTVAYWLAA